MGLFGFFKKPESKIAKAENLKVSAADELIDYVVGLVENKDNINNDIREINRLRKLSVGEREKAYAQIYLNIEKFLVTKKPTATKEYFSSTILKRQREYTREELRNLIKEKIRVNELNDNLRVLFLDKSQRSLIVYELMCTKLVEMLSGNTKTKILSAISKEPRKNFLNELKVGKDNLDFSDVNKKISPSLPAKEIIDAFKALFAACHDAITGMSNKPSADRVMMELYNYAGSYGYPLNFDALDVLPGIKSKDIVALTALGAIDYASSFFARTDMLRTSLEKISNAEQLPSEQKEKIYFEVYMEIEKLLVEHTLPAVKKQFTREELRREIRDKINVEHLNHKFRLLFLEEQEQIIELFSAFYEQLLTYTSFLWKAGDLQKFLNENFKSTELDVSKFTFTKEEVRFNLPDAGTQLKNKQDKLSSVIHALSNLLGALYKQIKETVGDKKAERIINDVYLIIREQYCTITNFDNFIRALPEGVMESQKRTSLSPKAAEQVVKIIIEVLQRENISDYIKAFDETKKLPLEEQSETFFGVYLDLQNYIIEHRPLVKGKEITISELKEKIRKIANIKDLEDKFQLLFLTPNEMLVKLTEELVRESIINFIDKEALIDTIKQVISKNSFLKNTRIDENGSIDFGPFLDNLSKVKGEDKILNATLGKIISSIYERARGILGESQAKKLFDVAYANLRKKYGANSLQVLKLVPNGVLESEKFELLGKEEIEKTAKEMVKIDIMKGEFMNIAAHELKTPLVPIISYLEMLIADKRIVKDQREKLKICLSSAKREADLVSDILDISKLEAGTLKFELETVDMTDLLKEITMGLAPAVKEKGIYFKTEIPSKLPMVRADRRRVIQVVANLINNATKFTEKGGITVRAKVEGKDIMVGVSDTGIGIDKENLKKLFTKFFQVDSSARRKQGGTGLGLAICKGIITGHHGKIWAESTPGKGTTFFFTIQKA